MTLPSPKKVTIAVVATQRVRLPKSMRGNIPKLYITNFLTGVVFWYGIEKLFMQSIGISTVGVAINAIVYIVISMVLNVPTGILADKWSRKYTLMLGIGALAVSSFMLGNAHSLAAYMMGTVIWGLYMVLTSGTFQAMTYDCLAELGREKEYVKQQGRSHAMFLAGIGLSSIVGGYVAHRFGYRASYMLTIVPCVLNLLVMASMREPVYHKDVEDSRLWQHIRKTCKLVSGQQLLLYLSMLFVIVGSLNSAMSEYNGLYYIALGFGAVGNGWSNAGKWVTEAVGQFVADRLGRYMRWLIPAFFATFMVFTVVQSPIGLVFFYLATAMQAIIATNVEGVIQHHTPSSIRATMISLLSFVTSVILVPVSIVFGYLAKHSIFHAYTFVGAIGLAFYVVWLLRPKAIRKELLHSMPTDIIAAQQTL